MEIKTSKGVYYVNADYTIEEKQGEYPKLTCTIPASKNKIWIDDCKELDRLYTPGEQDEFVIINPVKITKGDSYGLEITAVGAFEFDFVKSRIDDNLPTRSYTVEYLLDLVFKDARYSYDLQGTYEKREFTNFGSDNRYKLFLQIMNRFNLEFKVIGKIVRINSKIGNDTGFQFRYLKNIKDTKYSVDATNLVTHVKGYGAYHDANDQSKGRLEVEYLSPLSDIYGKLSGEPVVDERMSISATLLEKCKQSVESSVAVTVSTTLVALKNQEYRSVARVGDSIWFIDERIELEKKIRFSTVKSYYDAFDELIKQDVQLGDKDVLSRAQSSGSASQSKLIDMQKELSDQLADVEDAIKKTYVMPSGVNRVFYSSDLPEDVPKGTIKEGDTLFRNIDGETKMYRWDGVQWELVPVVNDVEKFREELDNEIAQVTAQIEAGNAEHDRQVADILSKTQSVESLANQAKSDAASAIARANQVKTEAIADARAQVATVSQALNTAKTELQTAIASADQKARDSQASATALRNDLNLQASKILAQAQAQTALTNRVSTVETLADGTKTTLTELSKTVNAQTGQIDSVSKRTKTVEDGLTGLTARYENLSVGGTNLADLSNKNGWYNSGGNFVADNKYNATEFIAVENVDYTLQFWGAENNPENWVGIVYFDENKQYIPNSYWSFYPKTGYKKKVLNPQNAKYIAISYYNSNSKVQLEKGTIASDYKIPDVAMQRQIAEYHQSATENYANLAQSLQTTDGLINDANTLIRQTAEAIKSYAKKSEVDTLSGRMTIAESLITQTAEGQEQLSTKLTETQGKVTTAETNIRQLVNDVSSKVSQTIFDNLKRTVESQGTAITQNQSAIALKAEKTYVDGVKTTADSALSKANANAQSISRTLAELEVTNDAVNTKVSQTEFNAVNQRLSTAETTIRTQAGLIEQRLTSTQVESAITGKGYQTASQVNTAITSKGYQTKSDVDSNITGRGYITSSALQPYATTTTVQNLVTETAGSFERQITETKALIPTEISNRNLIIDYENREFTGYNATNVVKENNVSVEEWGATNAKRFRATSTTASGAVAYMSSGRVPPLKKTYNEDTTYVGSVYVKNLGTSKMILHINIDDTTVKIPAGQSKLVHTKPNKIRAGLARYIQFVVYSYSNGETIDFVYWHPQIAASSVGSEPGPAPEDLVTETKFHTLQDTVGAHERIISDGKSISQAIQTAEKFERSIVAGGDIYQAIETAKGLVQEVSGANGLKTQVSQLAGSYAIKKLTKAGDVLGQINLNPDGSVRINEGLISVGTKTYIQDGVITSAKIAGLDAGKITTGTLNAARIAANSIDGSKMVFDQAFVNKMTANEAYLKQLFAKNAFITQVQSVTMSANQISGGVLKALNNAMEIQMNSGQILYYTDQAALKRVLSGYPTQFVKFATGTYSGVPVGNVVIGSNRWAASGESHWDGGFVGFKIWNGMNASKEIDIIEAVGDEFIIRAGSNENNGFIFNTAGFGFVPRVGNRGFIGDRDRYFKSGDFENIYLHQKGVRVNLVQLLRDLGGRI